MGGLVDSRIRPGPREDDAVSLPREPVRISSAA